MPQVFAAAPRTQRLSRRNQIEPRSPATAICSANAMLRRVRDFVSTRGLSGSGLHGLRAMLTPDRSNALSSVSKQSRKGGHEITPRAIRWSVILVDADPINRQIPGQEQ